MENSNAKQQFVNFGTVKTIKDGLILLEGLSEVQMGEEIINNEKNVVGMVLNLNDHNVGAIVLGEYTQIQEGDRFETTGRVMSVKASEEMIGRIINGIAQPIDGRGTTFKEGKLMVVDKIAPGVMDRQPVNEPLQTGVLAVDSMIPIGRGQRELVIGDRNTGKTALAVDTILNQKNNEKPVICIYVAIGQKQSRVAQLAEKLEQLGAMDYTIIVSAPASDPVSLQYIAPYSATAIAEYFMEQGKDVLIVYDDLSKHAWAYRQISLVLERPPGREAYPGDIFYLHSRLLERSCRLNEDLGGGSITSLPIVETQLSDVSAYIPTNIISITDGQIYFESDLFNSGFRPAIDPGNSVSRVGGSAQIKPMKKASGQLRLDLAQFKELEAFAQFGSGDLDERTKQRIERGKRIRELLKQKQYQPLPVHTQVGLIYAVNQGHFDLVEVEGINDIKEKYILYMQQKNLNDLEKHTDDFFSTFSGEEKEKMGKTREIKKRIKSVNNISQVTNAMQLVAASRMKKAQENAEKGKSYSEQIKQIMLKLSLNKTITDDPFIDPAYSQDAQADMIIVFSPQRGLAGALPSNLVRFATKFGNDIASAGRAVQLVTVGQKIRQQLANQPWEFVADFSDMPEQPTTADMRPLIKLIRDSYVNREIHRAYLIYPGFINALTQIPTARLLLPLDLEGLELSHETESLNTEMKSNSVYMFEPTREEIFEELIPAYIETQLYQTRLETIASEYSARMVAMKGATDNAKELKGDLTILYNKSRQAQITQEVAEINAVRSRN